MNIIKKILFFVLFFLLNSMLLFAQRDTIWYDSNWEVTKEKRLAQYFRLVKEKKESKYIISDYYINGKPQMLGTSLDATKNKWVGTVTWYFPNSFPSSKKYFNKPNECIKKEVFYQNGKLKYSISYVNNDKQGEFISYHSNGEVAIIGSYKDDNKSGKWVYYDKYGIIVGKITY